MNTGKNEKVIIVGGGLSGPVMAMYLAQKGYNIDVYEQRADMRKQKISAGRSINLALSKRGIRALEELGVFNQISPFLIPMYGRKIHDANGSTRSLPYGRKGQHINSVSRAELNKILISEAEHTGKVRFFFNHTCTGVDIESDIIYFIDNQSEKKINVRQIPVIATDGAGSTIRKSMSSQKFILEVLEPLGHAYKELTVPPDKTGDFQLDPNSLHIWPRGQFMLIALPNMDRSFTVTLFLPNKGEVSFESIKTNSELVSLFKEKFPDVLSLIPDLTHDYFSNPTGHLGTVRCQPWNIKNFLLIGDAAHAVVPFFGQGMNASFEDCTVLNEMMEMYGDWENLFDNFSKKRKIDGDAIADMALENYIEMRDLVNQQWFLAQKELEKKMEHQFPDQFISRYSMVSFHQIPYSVVQKRGETQKKIMEWILENETSGKPITSEALEKEINLKLPALNQS